MQMTTDKATHTRASAGLKRTRSGRVFMVFSNVERLRRQDEVIF